MGLSDDAVRQALEARRADREAKRLRALSTAWEIEAADRHRGFLVTLHGQEIQRFNWAADDEALFEKILERGSLEDLENNTDFNIRAYSHDLTSLAVADERLDQMGVEITRRELGDRPMQRRTTVISASSDDPLRPLNKGICLITSLGLDID